MARRRDELSRLGQSIGTSGFYCADGDVANCGFPGQPARARESTDVLGGTQGRQRYGYQPPEIMAAPASSWPPAPCGIPGFPNGNCHRLRASDRERGEDPAGERARRISTPSRGGRLQYLRYETDARVSSTRDPSGTPTATRTRARRTNDTYGGYLKGSIALPWGMQLTSITGYDHYDRLIDIDLDFSPETLFQIRDRRRRLAGHAGSPAPGPARRRELGALGHRRLVPARAARRRGHERPGHPRSTFGVGARDYTQDLWSSAGYASLAFDFWDDFTLDGGFRYNWEQKKLDYALDDQGSIGTPVRPRS